MDEKKVPVRQAKRRLKKTLDEYLDAAGNKIVAREKYPSLKGLDAVHFFLIERHHWTPAQVRRISRSDLAFCVQELIPF